MASDVARIKSILRHINSLCVLADGLVEEIRRKQRESRKIKSKIPKQPKEYKTPPCRDCGMRAWRLRTKDYTTICLNCGHIVDGPVAGLSEPQ